MQMCIAYSAFILAAFTARCTPNGRESRDSVVVLGAHEDWTVTVRFSPDGSTLASTARDGLVKLWDTTRVAELPSFKGDPDCEYNSGVAVAFSPDGASLLTLGHRCVRLRDVCTGQIRREWPVIDDEILRNWNLHGQICAVDFHPKGQLIACGGSSRGEGMTFLVDTAGDKIPQKLVGHRKGVNKLQWPTVTTLRFSPDGTMLASAGIDDQIVVWDMQTRKPKHVLDQTGAIWTVAWGPNSKRLASAGARGLIRIWEFDSRREPVHKDIPLHVAEEVLGQVSTLSFFPDGSRLLAAGTDYLPVPSKGFARIFDVRSGHKLYEIVKPEITFMCGEVSPDGKTVAIAADRRVLLWTPADPTHNAHARTIEGVGSR